MSTHRFHPDPERGDPPNAILYDDCERCTFQAKHPLALDREHLARIVRVCRDGKFDHSPTRTERQLEARVYEALCLVRAITGLSWKTLVDAGLAVPS